VEDWAQETWVRVLDRATQYDGHSRFEAWLFSIARNLAIDGEHSIPGVMQLSGPIVLRFVAGSLDTSVETSPPTLH